MRIIEPKIDHLLQDDVLSGKEVKCYSKMYKDVAGLYKSVSTSLSDNTEMYRVYFFEPEDIKPGNLYLGLTVLNPILVNEECNMTRGHFHSDRNCAEVYSCLEGTGLLMLMDEENNCWCEKVYPGSVHHIDGKLAHRLINTCESQLKVYACWPVNAGHDYETILTKGFPYRVYLKNKRLVVKDIDED